MRTGSSSVRPVLWTTARLANRFVWGTGALEYHTQQLAAKTQPLGQFGTTAPVSQSTLRNDQAEHLKGVGTDADMRRAQTDAAA